MILDGHEGRVIPNIFTVIFFKSEMDYLHSGLIIRIVSLKRGCPDNSSDAVYGNLCT